MFQFTPFPLPALCIQAGVPPHDGWWVSPFGYPRIKAFSAAPRGFSQPDTSFIGSRCQGIHRWLFVTWKNKDARARYAILKGRLVKDARWSSPRTGWRYADPKTETGRLVRARGLRGSDRHEERVRCTPSKRNRERRTRVF